MMKTLYNALLKSKRNNALSKQNKTIEFVKDKKNVDRATEKSMAKRLEVLKNTGTL